MTSPDNVGPTDGRLHRPGLFAAFRGRPRTETPAKEVVYVEQPNPKLQEKAAHEAYERGRRDERARHRGSPLLAFLILVIALAGGTIIYLAAREGSFQRGGQVVDSTIGQAAAPAKSAAASAGAALENAGRSLKNTAGTPAPGKPGTS